MKEATKPRPRYIVQSGKVDSWGLGEIEWELETAWHEEAEALAFASELSASGEYALVVDRGETPDVDSN